MSRLSAVPFSAMSVDDQIEWLKNKMISAAQLSELAAEISKTLGEHQRSLADLLTVLKDECETQAERIEVLEAGDEIYEAICELQSGKFHFTLVPIGQWEGEASEEVKGAITEEERTFLERYNAQKSRLGLRTQQEVADLVGIDRRHISRIEQGEIYPQFRTIEKIARGFNVPVTDLIAKKA